MHRVLVCLVLATTLIAAPAPALADSTAPKPGPTESDDLCAPGYQVNHRGACPLLGPGGSAERARLYDLPATLSPLAYTVPEPAQPVITRQYAKVVTPDAAVFGAPTGQPSRTLGQGFIYVSYGLAVSAGDQHFIGIHNGEYVRAADLATVSPSAFQGIALTRQPERPFAWVVRPFQPRLTPGGAVNPLAAELHRYDLVQIYAKQRRGEYDWYLVGRNQWVEQRNLGIVNVDAPPEGVKGKWMAVNLYEQTMAAYVGERMVYATLVSSGLGAWPTRPGLHTVYKKLDLTHMSGAFAADGSDYYYIEDVPWVLYFDDSISFHGTYWHNKFGFQQSHGCVNLSPNDSRWLYDWAPVGTTVYVYDPSGRTPTTPWTGGGP